MTTTKLVKLAKKLGLIQEHLDEEVHEIKASEASEINNDSMEAQIGFLLEAYKPEDLEARLREIAEEVG